MLDYANSAQEVPGGPFQIELTVAPAACDPAATYRWSVDGEQVREARGECTYVHPFEREGRYEVGLDVDGPRGARSSTRTVTVQDWLIVAIGDSIASGEGNPDRPAPDVGWQSEVCHRSAVAGTARAARRIEAADPRTSVTFVHLACSGAGLETGVLSDYRGAVPRRGAAPLPAQVAELQAVAAQREVDAVVAVAGANDVAFDPAVRFCVRFERCMDQPFDAADPLRRARGRPPLKDALATAVGRLPGLYARLADALGPELGPRTYLVEYHDPLHRTRDRFCELGIPHFEISEAEARDAYDRMLLPLNAAVRAAADAHGWRHVGGVQAEFGEGHGYCSRRTWIRRLEESVVRHGAFRRGAVLGTLHPNAHGHGAIAGRLAQALAAGLYPDGAPLLPSGEGESDEDAVLGVAGWVAAGIGFGALGALLGALATWLAMRRRR
ncbi:MAG TPA: GDSL-type esterase/lipase family protein [Thermoleophilaceae bacterium]